MYIAATALESVIFPYRYVSPPPGSPAFLLRLPHDLLQLSDLCTHEVNKQPLRDVDFSLRKFASCQIALRAPI